MQVAAVIVAAGSGSRLGGGIPKQYRDLGGRTVLARTLAAVSASDVVHRTICAINPAARDLYDDAVAGLDDPRVLSPVAGGPTRATSVRLALEALAAEPPDVVLVHDAARPFASTALWTRLVEAVAPPNTGAIAAERVVDALWREADGHADVPVARERLWRAQTPQAFPYPTLLAAHRADADAASPALDDAEVFRRAGHAVRLVEGEPENIKITTAADLARAERAVSTTAMETPVLASASLDLRVGHGFDVHRFGPGDHVTLCGVRIAHTHGLVGHSDADVGLHALADALYGALAEGDIGTHFPPSDPQWKGAASHVFLAHAGARVAARGGRIANVDITLLCERPRIGPHAGAMRAEVGRILDLDPGRVGLKATTMERMGPIGREEGMGCLATATVLLGAPS